MNNNELSEIDIAWSCDEDNVAAMSDFPISKEECVVFTKEEMYSD